MLGSAQVIGWLEIALHARDLGIVEAQLPVAKQLPLGFHAPSKFLDPQRAHQNFDARLVQIVAAALQVIDTQDRREVGQQVFARQELAHDLADDRGAA